MVFLYMKIKNIKQNFQLFLDLLLKLKIISMKFVKLLHYKIIYAKNKVQNITEIDRTLA